MHAHTFATHPASPARVRHPVPPPATRRPGRGATLSVARWIAITATFVNLGIHVAMAPDHIGEMLYIGVLFVIGSALLGAVMIGLSSDHESMRTPAWVGGSIVCAVEALLFVVSRTAGLPLGYHEGWTGSIENLLGLCSLFVEVSFIACALISLTRATARDQGRHPLVRWLPWRDRTAPLR
ncbi:MAG: hypothetical protein ACRDRN_25315 [Sciscionella sp.]